MIMPITVRRGVAHWISPRQFRYPGAQRQGASGPGARAEAERDEEASATQDSRDGDQSGGRGLAHQRARPGH
jgi:hypothetical protein